MTSRRETHSGDTQAEESIQFGPQTSSAERSRLGHGCKRKCKCKRGHELAFRNSTLAEAAAAAAEAAATAGATVLADRKRCSGGGGGGAVASACDA